MSDKKLRPEGFIPGRYPYTYAYDFVRTFSPAASYKSRSDIALELRKVTKTDAEKEAAAIQLADLYLEYLALIEQAYKKAKIMVKSLYTDKIEALDKERDDPAK